MHYGLLHKTVRRKFENEKIPSMLEAFEKLWMRKSMEYNTVLWNELSTFNQLQNRFESHATKRMDGYAETFDMSRNEGERVCVCTCAVDTYHDHHKIISLMNLYGLFTKTIKWHNYIFSVAVIALRSTATHNFPEQKEHYIFIVIAARAALMQQSKQKYAQIWLIVELIKNKILEREKDWTQIIQTAFFLQGWD